MFNANLVLEKLSTLVGRENVEIDVLMKKHTTFKSGGKADIFVSPSNYNEVRDCLQCCADNKVPYFVLGKGSNILVKDGGFRGVVINLNKLNYIYVEDNEITAQAGATLIEAALVAARNSLTKIEFASGIPGSIGGAVAMNAGAYGGEMSNIVKKVKVVDDNLEIKDLSLEEINFSYRNSVILEKSYIVLECTFKLDKGIEEDIRSKIKELSRRRVEKQPLEKASAGSTFKRPCGMYAGKLIEDTGLKGYKIGEAQISEKHSNFVVNNGNASSKEILDLINYIQTEVYNKFKVHLETEVRIIGDE